MKLNGNSLDEVLMKETLSDEDIVFLLGLTEPEDCKKLQEAAYKKTTELMGNKVYYRGLIEVSNVCTVDCRYCGIRKDNYGVRSEVYFLYLGLPKRDSSQDGLREPSGWSRHYLESRRSDERSLRRMGGSQRQPQESSLSRTL